MRPLGRPSPSQSLPDYAVPAPSVYGTTVGFCEHGDTFSDIVETLYHAVRKLSLFGRSQFRIAMLENELGVRRGRRQSDIRSRISF
jgi:hypothetical protein